MMSATRRNILKLIGGTVAAAPSAAMALPAAMAKADVLGVTGMIGTPALATGEPPRPVESASMARLGKPLWKYLEFLKRQHDEEGYHHRKLRVNGLDPDIAALRSVSAVTKARMQRQRNTEEVAMLLRIQNILWPDD